jgi:hypothetical protein
MTGESDNDDRLGRREAQDDVLVEALASGMTYSEAGAFGGVTARTVQRRMTAAEFRARVSQRRAQYVAEQTGLLVAGAREAIVVIQHEMRTAVRGADRMRAAALILNFALRYRGELELEARLREAEERLGITDAIETTEVV